MDVREARPPRSGIQEHPVGERITLALWPTVTRWRRRERANSNANRTIRCAPNTLIGFSVMPASSSNSSPPTSWSCRLSAAVSGEPRSNSIPWYRSSVFSRTITRSTSPCRVVTPGSDRAGRTAANRSRPWRSATFTLRNPVPTGVVIGPLIATRQLRIASTVSVGQERAAGLERTGAGRHLDPLDADVGGVQDQAGGGGDLGADPVAGDDRDAVVRHGLQGSRPPTRARRTASERCPNGGCEPQRADGMVFHTCEPGSFSQASSPSASWRLPRSRRARRTGAARRHRLRCSPRRPGVPRTPCRC